MQIVNEDKAAGRSRDREATRQNILDAALIEFSDNGLSGARVDAIAARTGTNVRMIYYYFASKEGLYRAVLEQCYAEIRQAELQLRLDDLTPVEAMRRLVEFVFDFQEAHPRFSRLVSIENIHRAEYIAGSDTIGTRNETAITTVEAILERGKQAGLFRKDATALGVHLLMTSFCFFRVSNRHTFRKLFQQDLLSPELRDSQRRMIVAAVLGFLMTPESPVASRSRSRRVA
jgi:AcrR family transcriptional regulator